MREKMIVILAATAILAGCGRSAPTATETGGNGATAEAKPPEDFWTEIDKVRKPCEQAGEPVDNAVAKGDLAGAHAAAKDGEAACTMAADSIGLMAGRASGPEKAAIFTCENAYIAQSAYFRQLGAGLDQGIGHVVFGELHDKQADASTKVAACVSGFADFAMAPSPKAAAK